MREIYRYLAADVKDKIVKIASLDPVLPSATEYGMYLSGKQRRRVVKLYLVGNRKKTVLLFVPGKGRRIGIYLEFDFHRFVARNKRGYTVIRIEQEQLLAYVSLDKSRLNKRFFRFRLHFRFQIQAVRPDLVLKRRKVCGQIKTVIRLLQREIQVFRKTVKTVEYPERGAAVKSGVLEKVGS